MIELRASLGDNAVILNTRTLDDGQVSVTGAVAEDPADLANVLDPPETPQNLTWLGALADFHEWPFKARKRIEPLLRNVRPAAPEAILTAVLEASLDFDHHPLEGSRPQLLSGPPGCGKTVTIAKLAAWQTLAGRTVDIITLDVNRAGSLDQLSTLLAPLDLRPIPVSTPAELPSTAKACKGDLIMIDSASVNPFDPADLGQVSTMASRANAELLLVMPAGLCVADSAEIARNYAALGTTAMVATKVDIARRLGGILAAGEVGLRLTKAGISPTVGDGLCSLNAGGLARLLLHRYRNASDEESDG
ncbi:MAG: hypothetical protein AAF543_16105 [Pseudomonadota bacterium]